MCGIIGGNWFTSFEQTHTQLNKIIHRGRDASIVDEIDSVFVGHNRLSIQDLSSAANQPMWNEDKTVCIVYNGELWDSTETTELKKSLKTKFITKSDTEIILNAYCELGTKSFELLDGMFSFCIVDSKINKVFVVRDYVGELPLWYAIDNDGKLVFCSEKKGLPISELYQKQVKVVYEDDQYFCIKPLTYEASVSYGYQTKWCTASVHDQSYFYNHSRDGVLVYVIDKINNMKFGFYHNDHQIQIYNQKDDRVDSMETGLPLELLHKLFSEMKSDVKDKNFNYKLFSESELKKMTMYRYDEPIPVPMEEMMTEEMTEEMIVERPTNEAVITHTGLHNDVIEDMRQRIRRLRPTNPLEVGDDLP